MSYFYANLSASIPASNIASRGGLSYLSAAVAVERAALPWFRFVDFSVGNETLPYLPMLGGALVATDMEVGDAIQRFWLPVMDRDHGAMDLKAITLTDVNNNRQRCLVKAIAGVTGVGMSVFLGLSGDGEKAVKMLGIEPGADLRATPPVIAKHDSSGVPYIEWTAALAAARITDGDFTWSVCTYDDLPYRKVLGGVQVDVNVLYRGESLTLGLPLMDSAFNTIPVGKATVLDWNKTVMRALAKAIAFKTGYGLAVYADDTESKEDLLKGARRSAREHRPEVKDVKETAKAQEAASNVKDEKPQAVVATAEKSSGTDAAPKETKEQAPEKVTSEQPKAEAAKAATSQALAKAGASSKAAAAEKVEKAQDPAAQAVEKFLGVMRSRKAKNGVKGMLTLFKALSISTVFAEEHKSACFAALTSSLAQEVGQGDIKELLQEMTAYRTAALLRADVRPLVASRLTAVAMEGAVQESTGENVLPIEGAAKLLIDAGLAEDAIEVVELAKAGSLPDEAKVFVTDALEGVLQP